MCGSTTLFMRLILLVLKQDSNLQLFEIFTPLGLFVCLFINTVYKNTMGSQMLILSIQISLVGSK